MSTELSIVIPAYNEERYIGRALEAIDRHLTSVRHEIIIVDNGSTDRTAQITTRHATALTISIPRGTIAAARNRGAAGARGKLIAFIDADVEITPLWAEAVKERLASLLQAERYIGGYSLDVPQPASLIERAWFATLAMAKPNYLGGANILVSPDTFAALQGFDEQLVTGEDVDFCGRAERLGLSIDYRRALRAIHLGFPSSLGRFVKREVWHGGGDTHDLGTFVRSKVAITAAVFLIVGVSGLLSLLTGRIRLGLSLIGVDLLIPLLFVLYKFRLRNARFLPVQYLLGHAYLAARAYAAVCGWLGLGRAVAPRSGQ